MFGSDLYIALVLGVILRLLFSERTGLVPAGMVVPGYLASIFDQPIFIAVIVGISLLTYVIVTYGLSRVTLLYGRRKFAEILSVGIVLKLLLDYTYPILPFEILEFRGIGVIVPGLIANTIQKQGAIITIGSTLLLSGLTFVILSVYYFI